MATGDLCDCERYLSGRGRDRMKTKYEIERFDGPERGIRVSCPEHGEHEEFPPGRRRVVFYCSGCGYELEVAVHDTHDWRDWGERC